MRTDLELAFGQFSNLSTNIGNSLLITNLTVRSDPWVAALGPTPKLFNYYEQTWTNMLQRVYNLDDTSFVTVDEIMANVSESLTHFVRAQSTSLNYSTPVIGVALSASTCVSAR
jgi:hypothetical protein